MIRIIYHPCNEYVLGQSKMHFGTKHMKQTLQYDSDFPGEDLEPVASVHESSLVHCVSWNQ